MGQAEYKPVPPPPPPPKYGYHEGVVKKIVDNSIFGYIDYSTYFKKKLRLYVSHPNYVALRQKIILENPYMFKVDATDPTTIVDILEVPTHTKRGKIKGFLPLNEKYMELVLTTSPIQHRYGFCCQLFIKKDRIEALRMDIEYKVSYKLVSGINTFIVTEISADK